MIYKVVISSEATRMLADIPDARIRGLVFKRIEALAHDPEKQGKALFGELAGLRSVRAVGQRYRIIYCAERSRVTISALAIGLRKEGDRRDIYELARKLVRLGLFKDA